jgi:inorganic phosphate transporter, PiT family
LPVDLLVVGLVAVSLGYGFLNGYNDAGAIIVGMIAGRTMLPRQALVLAAAAELAGPFLFGVGVAATVASGIVDPTVVDTRVVMAAVLGAIVWGIGASALGMPNSLSHGLVGGMVGAALSAHGLAAVLVAGVAKVLVFLIVAPVLGLVLGFIGAELLLYWLVQTRAHPEVVRTLQRLGVLSAMAFALGHGTNNAQKSMGLIALAVWLNSRGDSLVVPPWAVAASAVCLAAGVAVGGQKVIRTINARLYQLRTLHGLVAAATSAVVIFGATWGGLPISATQVASMAVAGAGAADRPSKVRWGVIGDILTTWAVTIPGAGLIAALLYGLLIGAGL